MRRKWMGKRRRREVGEEGGGEIEVPGAPGYCMRSPGLAMSRGRVMPFPFKYITPPVVCRNRANPITLWPTARSAMTWRGSVIARSSSPLLIAWIGSKWQVGSTSCISSPNSFSQPNSWATKNGVWSGFINHSRPTRRTPITKCADWEWS